MGDLLVFIGAAVFSGKFLLALAVVFWFILICFDLAIYHFGKKDRGFTGWIVYALPDLFVVFVIYFAKDSESAATRIDNALIGLLITKLIRWGLKYS